MRLVVVGAHLALRKVRVHLRRRQRLVAKQLLHAFEDELKTLGIESSPSFVRQPEGNGCVERFIRTLKEQLLWLHRFRTVEELNQALRDFARRFNNHWIIGRIGYRTPAAHRRSLLGEAA